MTRSYTDISHFRAPYKNAAVSGYGCVGLGCNGYGADAAPPPFYVTSSDGSMTLSPHWADLLTAALMNYLAHTQQALPGGVGIEVALQPYTAEQIAQAATSPEMKNSLFQSSAAGRLQELVAQDNAVFLSPQAVMALLKGEGIPAGHNKMIAFSGGSQGAKDVSKSMVLVGGSAVSEASLFGIPVKTLLIVGGVAIVGTLAYKSMKKSGRSTAMSL
jgi:hypothetical protein